MSAEHRTLTGADVHEPKGAESATNGQVYLSNGAGSGTWGSPITGVNNANKIFLTVAIANLSAAGSVFVVCPLAGAVIGIAIVTHGTITVANDTVSAKINGVAVTNSTVTIPFSGAAAGAVNTSTPNAANVLAANGALEIVNAGTSTTAVAATVTITVNVS